MVQGFAKEPHAALSAVDVVFLALHGTYGEDGQVQRLLEMLAIPYTGSRPYPSMLAMNKILVKEHLKNSSVRMAPHLKIHREETDVKRAVLAARELFGPDFVVKPVDSGSSVDVFLVKGETELMKAVNTLLQKRIALIIEKRIYGKEATVGVLERFRDQDLYALPAIEIVLPKEAEFFDYENKYNGKTEEICPGRFSKEEKSTLEENALFVHRTLGLSQYSRSDFIVAEDGVYFLEVNTLPGLTANSLLPKALEAVGTSYADFLEYLIADAMESRK
jgi:D-alanine-D-alanine ligase